MIIKNTVFIATCKIALMMSPQTYQSDPLTDSHQ